MGGSIDDSLELGASPRPMTLSLEGLCLILIPALPLLAAGIGALTPRRNRWLAPGAAIGALVISFALSCFEFVVARGTLNEHEYDNFTWFNLGHGAIRLGVVIDPLTAVMCVMVTFVSLLIFIFSL